MFRLALVAALVLSAAAVPSIQVPEVLQFPFDEVAKHNFLTAPYLTIDGVRTPITYNTILTVGQRTNANETYAFGQVIDAIGQPVYEWDKDGNADIDTLPPQNTTVIGNFSMSSYPDFTSLLQVGDRLFSFVHFESPGPNQAYLVELKQDTQTCTLSAVSQRPTNWSAWGGLWTPCAGSVSPWQTHLGSEEYEPSAYAIQNATSLGQMWNLTAKENLQSFMRYFGKYPNTTTLSDIKTLFKPYKYGHATEMTAFANGSYAVQKHYSMGRMAWELPMVLPDNQTAYGTDDGDNAMLLRFKASKPGDLSCGQLYGSRFNQTSAANGGAFTISWIDLGYACDSQLVPLAENTTFGDIFDSAPFAENATQQCPTSFTAINSGQMGVGAECLRLRPGQEVLASRFETRRYLALLGGTTEFSKMEGITFSPNAGENGRLFMSISRVENSMEDNAVKGKNSTRYDAGGGNHIRLPWNRCGCVYQLDVDQTYAATNMSALICGNTKNNTDAFNVCDRESISAPDNLSMMRGHNALIIGEDTSDHQNDAVWIYTFEDQKLSRVQTTPFGAETTSVYWYENINACSYLISVVQHPYGESDEDRATDLASTGKAARIGYLGPIRASTTPHAIRGPMTTASTAGRR